MVLFQFFAQNLHFAISLFAGLTFFAVFWLIFDAWTVRHELKELCKWLGFLLLGIAFFIYAAVIEQSSFGSVPWGNLLTNTSSWLRVLGYVAILVGQLLDPLQPVPKIEGLNFDSYAASKMDPADLHPAEPKPEASHSFWGAMAGSSLIALPIGALAVGVAYWRRATTGLERHQKPVSIAFFWFTAFEVLALASKLRSTTNPVLYNWVSSFGYIWLLDHLVLLIGSLILFRWVWRYLVKRLQSQLLMIFTGLTMTAFLVTTVSFTFLLMHNVENESLSNLKTAAQVLGYAIDSKNAETLADAQVLAQNPAIAAASASANHTLLTTLVGNYLGSKKLSSLVITGDSGQVLLQGEDPSRWGESISNDPQVRRALIGTTSSGVVTHPGVLAPTVAVRSAAPIRDAAGNIVGVAITEEAIDNGFVDGVKHKTGLDSAVYAGNIRSSTTFVAPGGTSRWVGVAETNKTVNAQVLTKGQTFSGNLTILSQDFLGVYTPLKDVNQTVVGMIFIGQPHQALLQTIARSIELTFIISVVLIIIMMLPAYLISRRIARQLS